MSLLPSYEKARRARSADGLVRPRLSLRDSKGPPPSAAHRPHRIIALRLALRHPDVVAALLLAAAAGISSGTRARQAALTMLLLARPTRLVAPFRGLVARVPWLRYPVFGYFEAADPLALSPEAVEGFLQPSGLHTNVFDAGRALVSDAPPVDLGAVRCPCLVISGARDH